MNPTQYTNQLPTEPGIYWFREGDKHSDVVLEAIAQEQGGELYLIVRPFGSRDSYHCLTERRYREGFWAGPIEIPVFEPERVGGVSR